MAACNRCGEKLISSDYGEADFAVHYRGISDGAWKTITLCRDCQRDLRREFYARGLTNDGKTEE